MQCQQCRTPNRAGAGWRARGEIAMRQRRWDEAETALREALALAIDNPGQLRRTHAALGRLREAQRKREEARAAYTAALAVVERMRAGLTTPETRAALNGAAFVKQLTDRLRDS